MESNYRRIVARSIVEFVGMKRVWNYMCGRARYKITTNKNISNIWKQFCKRNNSSRVEDIVSNDRFTTN